MWQLDWQVNVRASIIMTPLSVCDHMSQVSMLASKLPWLPCRYVTTWLAGKHASLCSSLTYLYPCRYLIPWLAGERASLHTTMTPLFMWQLGCQVSMLASTSSWLLCLYVTTYMCSSLTPKPWSELLSMCSSLALKPWQELLSMCSSLASKAWWKLLSLCSSLALKPW